MGWSLGWDSNWSRDVGYGVPAFCDHPACEAEIDRGLAYVCRNQEPLGGSGCGLYFCDRHRPGNLGCCKRCAEGEEPFDPKPDHPRWIEHKETHPSWAEWRQQRDDKARLLKDG
jgi:hypothetical protein